MRDFTIRRRLSGLLDHETVRFVMTGGGAAMLFYLMTFVALRSGAPPFAGTLTAYAVTVVTSYTIQHSWTFRGRRGHGHAFPRYVAAQVVSALLAATLARATSDLGLTAAALALVPTLAASAVSYVLSRYWVFAQTRTACSARPTSPNTRR